MQVAEQGEGPVVLLCHGFPKTSHSWRHQLPALAAAGFYAVAPDLRGYGGTARPPGSDHYHLLHLVGDLVGLLDALAVDQAVVGGNDWGATVAWHAALLWPDRFRGRRVERPPDGAAARSAHHVLSANRPGPVLYPLLRFRPAWRKRSWSTRCA